MRHLWPLFLMAALDLFLWLLPSCTTPPSQPQPLVHSIETITIICPGPLCAICGEDRIPND